MCETKYCRFGSIMTFSHPCKQACQHPKEKVLDGGTCTLSEISSRPSSGEPGLVNWKDIPEVKLPDFFEVAKEEVSAAPQFGKTVVIDEQDSIYKGKLSFEAWFEKNETEINIELAENGTDREGDFNPELEFEKRYNKYLLEKPTVTELAWEAWKQDQKTNMNDIDGHSFVHGYKAGCESGARKKYDNLEAYSLLKKFLADHPYHRGVQVTAHELIEWFNKNKKK